VNLSRPDAKGIPPSVKDWRTWYFVTLAIGAVVGVMLNLEQLGEFVALLARAKLQWLFVAISLQVSTYVSVSAGWAAVLSAAGHHQSRHQLFRIAIVKLFADQALPSAGMGGNVLLVDQLARIDTPRPVAMAALIMSLIGFYAAYATMALITLAALWLHGNATPLLVGLVTTFLLVALAIPSLALWLRHRGSRPLPRRIENMRWISKLLVAVGEAPVSLLRDRSLQVRVLLCNALILLADVATLAACLHAFGGQTSVATALIAFVVASIVVTLGPIPFGLGSFEATCTTMLHLLGVALPVALASTLLFRLLALWLPLVPGFLLMRSMAKQKSQGS
jgi:glycosyltransferase 2 family protein